MGSIVFVGMDIHKSEFAICCLQPELFGEDVLSDHMEIRASASGAK